MSTVYTTEDLLKILAKEYQACLKGQRLNLTATVSGVNPLIDQFVNTKGIQKFTAYLDFRATVHRYQVEHQVSGIVWRQLTIKGQVLRYPEVDEQLIALPSDLAILRNAKAAVLDFWSQVTEQMDLYLAVNRGKEHHLTTRVDVDRIAQRSEWVSLAKYEHANFLEIILQLGWGEPREARYQRGWPESGSEFVCAVNPGNRPIA
jgi:hypothetical protein